MEQQYFLIVTYKNSNNPVLITTSSNSADYKYETRETLVSKGGKFLEEGIISSYQIVVTDGAKVTN